MGLPGCQARSTTVARVSAASPHTSRADLLPYPEMAFAPCGYGRAKRADGELDRGFAAAHAIIALTANARATASAALPPAWTIT